MKSSDLDVFSSLGFPLTAERIRTEVESLRDFKDKVRWRLKAWEDHPSTANGFRLLELLEKEPY